MSMKKNKGLWIALGILGGIIFLGIAGLATGAMIYMVSVEKESPLEVSVEATEAESSETPKESTTAESEASLEASLEASSEASSESESSSEEESEATYNSADAEQMLEELLELYEQRPSVSELE